MPCLLIGQVVDDRIAELQVFVRTQLIKVLHRKGEGQFTAAPLHSQLHGLPHAIIEYRRERHELGQVAPSIRIVCRRPAVCRPGASRQDLAHYQHANRIENRARTVRSLCSRKPSRVSSSKAVCRNGRQRPRDRLPGLQERKRPLHQSNGKKLDAAWLLAPALSAITRPSMSIWATGRKPPDVLEAACR